MRILILGGTTEASELVRQIAGDDRLIPTLSLAGRTAKAAEHHIDTRVGGFGGLDGLEDWLRREKVEAVIDATHPFAARISQNAKEATARVEIPLCTILRPEWKSTTRDRWTLVPDVEAAASALGDTPRRVFLSIGRQTLAAFASAPHHTYLVRTIEAPDCASLPPNVNLVKARGPFDRAGEAALLRDNDIDVIVSKNSGGKATYPKIQAASDLAIPVIMISRPHKACGNAVTTAAEAHAWLIEHHDAPTFSERGV
jgi:precorrin-6A/cobalt-precorrin-6A reductase